MPEHPIVVRDIGGRNRLGVEEAADLEADVRDVVAEGSGRIDVANRADGETVGIVVAHEDRQSVESIRWHG